MAERKNSDAETKTDLPETPKKRKKKAKPPKTNLISSSPLEKKDVSYYETAEYSTDLNNRLAVLRENSLSPEDAFAEISIHSAMAVLITRAERYSRPPVCCRCSADPAETMCRLYVLDAQGQYKPGDLIPRSQSSFYSTC